MPTPNSLMAKNPLGFAPSNGAEPSGCIVAHHHHGDFVPEVGEWFAAGIGHSLSQSETG
jgi:hypothetical protein